MLQSTLQPTTWQMGQNTAAIWTTATLQYLLITVDVIMLEKAAFSVIQNPKSVSY